MIEVICLAKRFFGDDDFYMFDYQPRLMTLGLKEEKGIDYIGNQKRYIVLNFILQLSCIA